MHGWPPRIAISGSHSATVIARLIDRLIAAGLVARDAAHADTDADLILTQDLDGAVAVVESGRGPDHCEARVHQHLAEFHASMPVCAAVLVGGASRRMGRPKTMLTLGDRSILERIVNVAERLAHRVVLVGSAPVPDAVQGLTQLPDAPGVDGPLAGVLGAMRHSPQARWLVLACDLAMVGIEAARWLLSQAGPGRWAVLPHLDLPRHREPVFAVYDPPAGVLLEQGARRGERAICRILDHRVAHSPRVPAPFRDAWTNVNAPADLDALRARQRRRRSC